MVRSELYPGTELQDTTGIPWAEDSLGKPTVGPILASFLHLIA